MLDLIPSFTQGVHSLHDQLIGVAFVLAFAGLIIHTALALYSGNVRALMPTLVRLAIIPMVILGLESWGDTVVENVQGLIDGMGGTTGSNIFQDYQAAIARKMGSQAAAQNINQGTLSNVPISEGDTSGGFNLTPQTSVMLTHYAYPGDTSHDSNSSKGIGAFPFSSAPGSLIPMYSAALTDSSAKAYNVKPGQSFNVTTASGKTYNLVYADHAPESDMRVDIYDPGNQLGGGNNFSDSVSSVNGGPLVMGQTGLAAMMPNPGGSIGDQVLWAITLGLSWVASGIMYLMVLAQKMLYLIEIAISPIFCGLLMIPALSYLARRFFLILVTICLWPFGWAVCNLASKALIDLAVNPTDNAGLGIANTASLATGPLAGIAYLLVVAVWIIGSTLAAPLFISALLGSGGGSATGAVFGATLGAAAMSSMATGNRMVGGVAGAASIVSGIGSGVAPSMSSSRMGAPRFSRRPIDD